MKGLGKIGVVIEDQEQFPSSLWTSPSSPPYTATPPRIPSSPNQRAASYHSSSPSTPSEFEFDSAAIGPEVRDEPPVSPKFISSHATGYWAASSPVSSTQISSLRTTLSLIDCASVSSSTDRQHDASAVIKSSTGMPSSHSTKQLASTPASPSVRQLITREMRGEQHDSDSYLDFYSAPQIPTASRSSRPHSPKQIPLSLSHEPAPLINHQQSAGVPVASSSSLDGRRKSKSVVLDRREIALYPELGAASTLTGIIKGRQLTPSKSEAHSHFDRAAAASSASSLINASWEKSNNEEEKSNAARKAGPSKSFRKWAFKDLLRRTVPSSKADAHYITKTLGAANSSHKKNPFSISAGSTPILVSPQASPPRPVNSTFQSAHDSRPSRSSRAPRSPPHRPASTFGRSSAHPFDTRSEPPTPHFPSTPSRTPAPSPPRSPLSSHAIHYKLQKAQSQELGRKTFLPYRQSLLGCLGGSSAFSSDQLVW